MGASLMIVSVSPGSEENIHKVIPTPRQVLLTKSLPYDTPKQIPLMILLKRALD
jgi:hypothetical protein